MNQVNENAARKAAKEQLENNAKEEKENNVGETNPTESNNSNNPNSVKQEITGKVEEKVKKNAKRRFLRMILGGGVGTTIIFIVLMSTAVGVALDIIKPDNNNSSGRGSLAYESECNYEETKVVVMNGAGTQILTTISLEDYIIGVACPEIGACNGASSTIAEHYVKTQYIASKTYVLSLGNYNSSSKSITVKASTRNQQWCDLTNGCIVTYDGSFHNTYPANYSTSEQIIGRHSFTEEDKTTFRKYYQETYGELYLPENYNKQVTSLNWETATEYKANTQNYWNSLAQSGNTYDKILKNTATSGKPDAEDYVGKTIYQLGSYCKATYTGNYSSDIEFVDVSGTKEINQVITNLLSSSEIEELNDYIVSSVEAAGHGTGDAVVAAGSSLIYGLYKKNYHLPYWYGGGHALGLTVGVDEKWGDTSIDPSWRSYNQGKNRNAYSYDCSGFVSWSIKNGCKSSFSVDYTGGFINNYGKHINLKDAKPGDLMVIHQTNPGGQQHVRLIVKNNGDGSVVTAESTSGFIEHGGIQFQTYSSAGGYSIIDMKDWYANNCENIQPPKQSSNNKDNNSTSKNKILLIAGHSYQPYCSKLPNECRGKAPTSTYAEETETRKLIQLLKTKLISLGYSETDIDIANELLGENFNDTSTSKSLYGEIYTNSQSLNNIDFSKYNYAIEIHFNASPNHNSKGVATLCDSGDCKGAVNINSDIRNEISSILGSANNGVLNQSTYTLRHFKGLNIPFTYLETEYYDNQSAMDNYVANIDKVADAIANNIKKYYP